MMLLYQRKGEEMSNEEILEIIRGMDTSITQDVSIVAEKLNEIQEKLKHENLLFHATEIMNSRFILTSNGLRATRKNWAEYFIMQKKINELTEKLLFKPNVLNSNKLGLLKYLYIKKAPMVFFSDNIDINILESLCYFRNGISKSFVIFLFDKEQIYPTKFYCYGDREGILYYLSENENKSVFHFLNSIQAKVLRSEYVSLSDVPLSCLKYVITVGEDVKLYKIG